MRGLVARLQVGAFWRHSLFVNFTTVTVCCLIFRRPDCAQVSMLAIKQYVRLLLGSFWFEYLLTCGLAGSAYPHGYPTAVTRRAHQVSCTIACNAPSKAM